MFVDSAKIYIQSGKGGNGCVSFRREKYIPAGGPDGGDGGKGGDIIFAVESGMSTLADFRYKRKYKARNGQDGGASKCSGRKGENLIIKVPNGTIIKDSNTGQVLADMTKDNETYVAAKGGIGGWGNCHFSTSTRQAPKFAKPGQLGEEKEIILELKLLADVGLIGFPNVGKSTILSMITEAKPKIANYHFTTLEPNLGVVNLGQGNSFVLADIPGIIEGAHEGVGLGHEFLKHVERTRLLIHVVDVSQIEGRNSINDFNMINKELEEYSTLLAQKPQVVAANKMDLPEADKYFEEFKKYIESKGLKAFAISAATGKGVRELMLYVSEQLKDISIPEIFVNKDKNDDLKVYKFEEEKPFNIRIEDGVYIIEGKWIDRIVSSTNFEDTESLQFFQNSLKKKGILEQLEKMGINEGDIVKVHDMELEYIK